MIIVQLLNGRSIACRGGDRGLGLARRILFTLRLPMPFQSFTDEDRFLVKASAVAHFGFITDDVAVARRKAAEDAEASSIQTKGRMVQIPGMRMPGRRGS